MSTTLHLKDVPILGDVTVDIPEDEWHVEVQYPAAGDEDQALTERIIASLDRASCSHDGAVLRVGFTVTAPTLRAATVAALAAASKAHGARPGPIRLTVQTELSKTQELAQPAKLDLLGQAEVAEELGVKGQRVPQLLAEHPNFPAPVGNPSSGRVWTRDSILAFKASWVRKSGRPKKVATDA